MAQDVPSLVLTGSCLEQKQEPYVTLCVRHGHVVDSRPHPECPSFNVQLHVRNEYALIHRIWPHRAPSCVSSLITVRLLVEWRRWC